MSGTGFRRGLHTVQEAEIAAGSLLGIPPSSIRGCVVVAVDDAGKLHIAGPGIGNPAKTGRIAGLLAEAARVLREQVP